MVVVVVICNCFLLEYSLLFVPISLSLSAYLVYLSYTGSSPSQSVDLASALTALFPTVHLNIDHMGRYKCQIVIELTNASVNYLSEIPLVVLKLNSK